ncbi:MAG: ribose 5-phosphate isomerase A [Candidatus Thorarchaeota archaeon]
MSNAKMHAVLSALGSVPSCGTIGLGSGSTMAIFARELGNKIRNEKLDLSVVPTSYQAYRLAIENGLPLTTLDEHPDLSLAIDGADEVDEFLNLIKGGGGALLREKVVAYASRNFIVVVDESKLVRKLGARFPIPVEVLPFAVEVVRRKFAEMGLEAELREGRAKLGPVVTDNGNFILDLKNVGPLDDPRDFSIHLRAIPGVIETGLFIGMTHEVHVGTETGAFIIRR